jgi:hypothetical protein
VCGWRKGDIGRWQLRAVLSVPVPGHSSPLLAAAVERGNLALAASAAAVLDDPDTEHGRVPDTSGGHAPDTLAALLEDPDLLDALSAALARRETERREEVAALSAAVLDTTTIDPEGDQ